MDKLTTLSAYNYELAHEQIATIPSKKRSSCRLLRIDQTQQTTHHQFYELIELLRPGDLLVLNNSKVIKARLVVQHQRLARAIELLYEKSENDLHWFMIRGSKKIKVGDVFTLALGQKLIAQKRQDEFWILELECDEEITNVLERNGQMPLPPYINRQASILDNQDYQTVYAKNLGSVAAPTAGLHFDKQLLIAIAQKGINICELCLHVGSGTYQSLRTECLPNSLHTENYSISHECAQMIAQAKQNKQRIVACGTTTLRALEHASLTSPNRSPAAGVSRTNLFIKPGYKFLCADALITNFHLPKSSLLILVSAFCPGGLPTILHNYHIAIEKKYRFFSYGDAMLIERS